MADGCSECGMAYSFYFGTQFHKHGCSKGNSSDLWQEDVDKVIIDIKNRREM